MTRGRKSRISLSLVPPSLPCDSPAPPAEIDAVEVRIRRAIVGTLPRPGVSGAENTQLHFLSLADEPGAAPRARVVSRGGITAAGAGAEGAAMGGFRG